MKTIVKSLIMMFFTLLVLQGCGYHNPYVKSAAEGKSTALVYMTVWPNQTNELGMESLIFQKTADWLQQSRHLRITSNKDQADYILNGKILSVNYPATAFSVTDVASTLQATVKVSYRLTNRATGLIVWNAGETIRQTSYPAGTDAVRSQSNKKIALTTIANELAEQIYLKITTTLINDTGQ